MLLQLPLKILSIVIEVTFSIVAVLVGTHRHNYWKYFFFIVRLEVLGSCFQAEKSIENVTCFISFIKSFIISLLYISGPCLAFERLIALIFAFEE